MVMKKTVSQLRERGRGQKEKKSFHLFSSPSSLIKKEDLRDEGFLCIILSPFEQHIKLQMRISRLRGVFMFSGTLVNGKPGS